jgi:signal transduction histidine kinase/DNA-binding response OmpR family regulator
LTILGYGPADALAAAACVCLEWGAARGTELRQEARSLPESSDWLAGSGEMAERIRRFDWSATPLGPSGNWSVALRTTVGLMLANRFPMLLWWGPDYICLYNDAYIPVLGLKHPDALGLPVRECWSEIWDILKPLVDTPFNGGPSTWLEDIELHIRRSGFTEETHFTVAYSPVPDATTPSGIGGVLATVHEISQKVVAERRVSILRDLGTEAAGNTAEDVCDVAAQALARHSKDVPFALLYLIDSDGKQARLAGAAGTEPGKGASPRVVSLDPACAEQIWPFAAAVRGEDVVEVTKLPSLFEATPAGPWEEPLHTAVVLPLRSAKANEPFGLLVGGVSSRLKFDDQYKSFYELAANQIATAIANARAYEEERKRAEALAEIDRVKTAFFSNVSHEFRTPLTLMLGPLEELKRELGGTPDSQSSAPYRQVDLVQRNGLRLLKLVNTLLDFSRIEAGRVRAVYEPVDLSAFTAELVSVFRSAVEKAGLQLNIDCPPMSEPAYIDREMWEKIVLNLVSNAFKFTFDGGIEVKLRDTATYFELTVRDTGTGIPAVELPKLFERFHRVAGARGRTHEGSGIGLALVQELVRLHGGAVVAESTYGEGTTFRVRIPPGASHLPQAQIGAARTQAPTAIGAEPFIEEALRWLPDTRFDDERAVFDAPAGDETEGESAGRPRILLVDDNADMRDYVQRLLGTRYDVQVAEDGEAALMAIEKRRPDLVLSDIMMPRLDGLGLLTQLRSNPRTSTLPIILLSARAGEESRVEGLQTGADDYLIKPFTARELLVRVAAHLQMARIRRNATKAAEASEARLAAVLQQLPVGVGMTDQSGRLVVSNAAMRHFAPELIPSRDAKRRHRWRAWAPDGSALEPSEWPGARALRGETVVPGIEMLLVEDDGQEIWNLVSTAPMRDAADAVIGAVVVVQDIGERKRAEETQRLLVAELNHRVKNTLANVQAIAHQTLRRTQDPAEFAKGFTGRIQSLSRVHTMLSSTTWQGVDLRDLVRDQLLAGAVDETRITAWGPPVHLDAQLALHAALMLHELGTNAIKYGALSAANGIVTISWSVADAVLALRWEERGGPAVRAPATRGFGRTLIEQSAKGEGGEALMSIEAEGVVWNIKLPLGEHQPVKPLAAQFVGRAAPEAATAIKKNASRLAGKRLLVVEDEALVALDIVAALESASADVVGTASTAKEALNIIDATSLDGALLDANLRGHPVDEIAAALVARNIPFLFVTGYGSESLPKAFAKTAMIIKPFSQEQLIAAVASLGEAPATVHRLRR